MVKIFLAGAKAYYKHILQVKPHYCLITFYPFYAEGMNWEIAKKIKAASRQLMVDSGAFTFMAKGEKEVSEDYIKEYVRFVKEIEPDYYFTIDVGDIEQQKEYHLKLVEAGLDPIPVYHLFDKSDAYLKWVVEHKNKQGMVAIGGYALESQKQEKDAVAEVGKIITKMLNLDKSLKIHILGMTSIEGLKRYARKIYSVDSTAWIGSKIGAVYLIERREIKPLKVSLYRGSIKLLAKKYDIPEKIAEDASAGRGRALSLFSLYVWKKYQEIMDAELKNKAVRSISENGKQRTGQVIDRLGRNATNYRFNAVKHGLYAKKLRGLVCNNCPISDKCPQFQEGAVCYYEKRWRRLGNTRNRETILKLLETLIKDAWYRWNRARAFQDAEGGFEDKSILALEKQLLQLIEFYDKLLHPEKYQATVNISHKQQVINIAQLTPEKLDEALKKARRIVYEAQHN